jgi:tripartite-type tricarboxylate transporter receptor subunit TctC
VREGRLRALAVTSPKRSPSTPELPAMAELGFPGFDVTTWFGLFAPRGTPAETIAKLHLETTRAMTLPDVRRRLEEHGIEPIISSPGELASVVRSETLFWARLVKDAGVKLPN